jgi:hypothetical protein
MGTNESDESRLIQCDTDCMITVPRYTSSSLTPIPKTWEEYISLLPEWTSNILQNMVIEEQTPLWLFPGDDLTPIFVVSDGSVIAHKGVLISGRVCIRIIHVVIPGRSVWDIGMVVISVALLPIFASSHQRTMAPILRQSRSSEQYEQRVRNPTKAINAFRL